MNLMHPLRVLVSLSCSALAAAAAAEVGVEAEAAPSAPVAAHTSSVSAPVEWHLVKNYGAAMLHGKAAFSTGEQTQAYYSRLPASAENSTRPSIWGLSNDPAGTFLQFSTNSSNIWLNYTLGSSAISMWHFPSTGVSGADLYCYDEANATWRWVATTRPTYPITSAQLVSAAMSRSTGAGRKYRLHLPTYNEVRDDLTIGLDAGSSLTPDNSTLVGFQDNESIVWYGSSILQGGVASRPGQIATHEVVRRTGRLIYNFGFSGNCWMELSVAQYLVAVTPKPAMFIIDCNPNMVGYPSSGGVPDIYTRTVPLVEYIRANGHPDTPIVLSEGTTYGSEWSSSGSRANQANKSAALKQAFDNLTSSAGGHTPDEHLYYAEGPPIFSDALNMRPEVGGDLDDPTVAGTHPTDLGMMKQAKYWSKLIPQILEVDQHKAVANRVSRSTQAQPNVPAPPKEDWTGMDFALATGRASATEVGLAGVMATEQSSTYGSKPVRFASGDVEWFDAEQFLQGRAEFVDPVLPRMSPFDRLPADANGSVDDAVWSLSRDSTGMFLRVTTNGSAFALNHTLAYPSQDLWHMPQTGTDGFDVYAWDSNANVSGSATMIGAWRHLPSMDVEEYHSTTTLSTIQAVESVEPLSSSFQTFLVYLPLRNAPASLSVGFSSGDAWCTDTPDCQKKGIADPAPSFRSSPPVVWYGTSIQQGGVASRAGTEYDAIISRALSREIINFGFAGHGTMQLNVAKYLADIPSPVAAFVIDCLPNMNAGTVANRTEPLIHFLRSANNGRHAETPIILAEGTPYPAEWYGGPPYADQGKNDNLRTAYNNLVAAGDQNLHYVVSADLFGSLGPLINPTVGGTHSSDLGQYAIADYYVGALPSILK